MAAALTSANAQPSENKQLGQYFESATPFKKSPSLPNDILYEIFSYYLREQEAEIRNPSPERNPDSATKLRSTLCSVLFLSRRFYLLVRPFLYHTICLSNSVDVEKLYNTVRANPSMRKHVKALLVMEPTDFSTFPKTKDPTPDLLDIVPRRKHRVWYPREHSTALQAGIRVKVPKYLYLFLHQARRSRDAGSDGGGGSALALARQRRGSRHLENPLPKSRLLHARFRVPAQHTVALHLPDCAGAEAVFPVAVRHQHLVDPQTDGLEPDHSYGLVNAGAVRPLKSLEVLSLHLCPMFFFRPDEQSYLEAALQTQATNLKELRLSAHSTTAPKLSWYPRYKPYVLS
ncbi:hypothetical protein ASPCAL10033 [Aspergillus calidoustus]|uniref:Uncharacterized protein n=1 Tax=Aspergillus calidoustus TaxID=454130 RepID=A0A0U5G8C3_ASPCI|nr:hypothetical protein ASPCAL10033 [Aspergillus calidoustus]